MMKKTLVTTLLLTAAFGLVLPAAADEPPAPTGTVRIVTSYDTAEPQLYLDPGFVFGQGNLKRTLTVELVFEDFNQPLAAFVTALKFEGESSTNEDINKMGLFSGDAGTTAAAPPAVRKVVHIDALPLAGNEFDEFAGLVVDYWDDYAMDWPFVITGGQSEAVEMWGSLVEKWTSAPDQRTIGIVKLTVPDEADPQTQDPVFSTATTVVTITYDYNWEAVGNFTVTLDLDESMFVSTDGTVIPVNVVDGNVVVRPGPKTWPTRPGDANLDGALLFADASFIHQRMTGAIPWGTNARLTNGWQLDVDGNGAILFSDINYVYNVMTGAWQPY